MGRRLTFKENTMKNRSPYYEVYQGADSKWRWRQVAGNGQKTAAQGEYSASKRGAIEAVHTAARITYECMYGTEYADPTDIVAKRLKEQDSIRICDEQEGECDETVGKERESK
jgi:uncharacterized protein YegP (UPF0339 family)